VSSSDGLMRAAWAAQAGDYAAHTPATDLSDEQLMARIQQADQGAFAVLMRRHARAVLAVGRRVLHDQGAAEELVQDVFLLVYKRAGLFDPQRGSFRAWLIQIAYNEAYRARQRVSQRYIYEDQTIGHCQGVTEPNGNPEYQAALLESEASLREAFRSLNSRQQQTMELFFFEGYTLREISEKIGESLENVRHHYYRSLKKLKNVIGSRGKAGQDCQNEDEDEDA